MSFWNTHTGEDVTKAATGEYTIGGDVTLIPDGSTVQAYIKDVRWARNERGAMEEYINVQWKVEAPESLAGRVAFQKLWVKDPEPNALKKGSDAADKKREKALRTLANIDENAGGRLAQKSTVPTDDELLLALANKSMCIHVKVYSMTGADGGKIEGNWIAAVMPKGEELKAGKDAPKPSTSSGGVDDLDGDLIPF